MQAPDNKVSLGCGTLILIALIVMIFGNSKREGDKELSTRVFYLDSKINSLQNDIEKQSATLIKIQQSLDEINKQISQGRPRVVTPAPRTRIVPPPDAEAPLPQN